MWKMLWPSRIWRLDLNPQPSEHKYPPITTRPGLLPFTNFVGRLTAKIHWIRRIAISNLTYIRILHWTTQNIESGFLQICKFCLSQFNSQFFLMSVFGESRVLSVCSFPSYAAMLATILITATSNQGLKRCLRRNPNLITKLWSLQRLEKFPAGNLIMRCFRVE